MSTWKVFRAFLLPRNILLAATPIVAQSKEPEKEKSVKAIRPSELPIYVDEIKREKNTEDVNDDIGAIEQAIGTVRKELCSLVSEVTDLSNKASAVIKENWEASNEILDYLKEEDNVLPRSGAIVLSGLTGLVFAIRRGFFKRLIYMSLGAGGMASLCYPKEAEEYFDEGMVVVRKYGLIGHHLATSILDDLRGSSSDSSNDSTKEGKEAK